MPYEAKSSAADRAAFNGAFTRMLGLAHFALLRLKWIVVGSRLVFAIGVRVQVSDPFQASRGPAAVTFGAGIIDMPSPAMG